MMRIILVLIVISIVFHRCLDIRIDEHKSWQQIFSNHGIDGGFEIYDNNREIANYYNKDEVSRRFLPGSTMDIFSSLVGLEIPVILDENKPPSIHKQGAVFGTDTTTLRTAFLTYQSTFFQTLHQGIGDKSIKWYLDTVKYGSMQWHTDTPLMITPDEQVGLMKRLYHQEIPSFSRRVQQIVLSMMKQVSSDSLTLYYRTATIQHGDTPRVWIVGIAEGYNSLKNPKTQNIDRVIHPYFFALNAYKKDKRPLSERDAITILQELLIDYRIGTRK